MAKPLLSLRKEGLYCAAGDFYIDPWRPVERAVITHGHSDHARWGMKGYLCSTPSVPILRHRLEEGAKITGVDFGEERLINGVTVSFHPAGHIPGSAQVRVEHQGQVWVASGDYKTEPDATSEPFEPIRCHGFVTETTFGLPIYQWRPEAEVMGQINDWWRANQEQGRASVLFGYALGKAQRVIGGVDAGIGPIVVHGAVEVMNRACIEAGVKLPQTMTVSEAEKGFDWSRCLIVAPPSANGTPWMRRFGTVSTAFASGWMAIRGARRRQALDRGFVLSDHVDWQALLDTVEATGAEQVWTTHGYAEQTARYLREERGLDARAIETEFRGEVVEGEGEAESSPD